MLNQGDIPNSKVYSAADIAADPQYRERGMVREVIDPNFGRAVLHPGIVPHVVDAPPGVRWPGPAIGAHTDEVLRDLLRMDDATIAGLRADGVV